MARAIGLNHVALDVGDLDQALDFWHALFPELALRGRGARAAFIDLGDQFIALFQQEVEPRSESRHFGLVVDDVPAVLAAARANGARVDRNRVKDPWGNGFDVVAYSEVQFTKTDAVLRAQHAGDLLKDEAALEELRAKGVEA